MWIYLKSFCFFLVSCIHPDTLFPCPPSAKGPLHDVIYDWTAFCALALTLVTPSSHVSGANVTPQPAFPCWPSLVASCTRVTDSSLPSSPTWSSPKLPVGASYWLIRCNTWLQGESGGPKLLTACLPARAWSRRYLCILPVCHSLPLHSSLS